MIRFSAAKVVVFLQITKPHNKFAIIIQNHCASHRPALLERDWGDGLPYLGGRVVITFAKWLSCRHCSRVILFFSL